MNRKVIRNFRRYSVAVISDVFDFLNIENQTMNKRIKPIVQNIRSSGFAKTIKLAPLRSNSKPSKNTKKRWYEIHLPYDKIFDQANRDDVFVFDASGYEDACVWGEIATLKAISKNLSGVIIDGGTRDVQCIRKLKFPVFATHIIPVEARGRLYLKYINKPVRCGDIEVYPRDVVVFDDDGIAVIPQNRIPEILKIAKIIYEEDVEKLKSSRKKVDRRNVE